MDNAFEYVISKEKGRYMTGTETAAQFYKRATDTEFIEIRERFNNWFNEYPPEERNDIKNRLASNRDVFDDIFYELFLYQLFKRQGFTISIHPHIANIQKHPDFLIEKDNFKCYVEATIVRSLSKEEKSIEKNKELIYQAINSINTNGYIISILEFEHLTNRTLSGKAIAKDILKILEIGSNNRLSKFDFIIEDETYRMKLGAYFNSKYRHDPFENRSNVMSYEPSVLIGDNNHIFCKGFKEKATRYGKLDLPFIVCVNSSQFLTTFDWEDIDDMLLRNVTGNNTDKNEIIFSHYANYLNTRVSAILFTYIVNHPVKDNEFRFVKHPKADIPIDFSKFSLAHHEIRNNSLIESNGFKISELIYPHLY